MSAPCHQCGRSAERTSVCRDGTEITGGFLCDLCLDKAWDDFHVLRAQFEELIAAGVPRNHANDIIIARILGTRLKS